MIKYASKLSMIKFMAEGVCRYEKGYSSKLQQGYSNLYYMW